MRLQHPLFVDLLKMAYSAEKAAAFAYQGIEGAKFLDLCKAVQLTMLYVSKKEF